MIGDESLFQASARRFTGNGFADPVVVMGNDFRFIVTEQLDYIGLKSAGIMIEPEGRNTAPAAIASALVTAKANPDTIILLVPSDHAVADPEAFRAAVAKGQVAAEEWQIVTFGIAATRAEELFADKRYLWNAGVFLASAQTFIAAFKEHAPAIYATVEAALKAGHEDLSFTRLDPDLWAQVPEDSIDYAVMEKAENVSVVRFDGHWSDLGGWESVWLELGKDEKGNALSAHTTAFDCENTLLRSESDEIELGGIGLKNTVAVTMRNAVMVANISESQNVKKAVKELKARGAKQAQHFPVGHRPWGWYETLVLADRFQVKRIHVHPGASLSLQSHGHRSEHWIVVAGTAKVTVDDKVQLLTENQSVYIPLGAVHRMNPGKVPMVLIEVQTGSYLGEDDIIRYEDKYARGQGAKG